MIFDCRPLNHALLQDAARRGSPDFFTHRTATLTKEALPGASLSFPSLILPDDDTCLNPFHIEINWVSMKHRKEEVLMDEDQPTDNEAELREALAFAEQTTGPNSFETAVKLVELAAVLREKKRSLEAVNLEARAKKIRIGLGIDQGEQDESIDSSVPQWQPTSRKQRIVIITSTLVVLFGVSIACRLASSLVPVCNVFSWMFSGIAFVIIGRAGFPFNVWQLRAGIFGIWVLIVLLLPSFSITAANGWRQVQAKNYRDALFSFDILVKQHPDEPNVWLGRAAAEAGLGQHAKTISDCNQAFAMMTANRTADANKAALLLIRGYSYLMLEKYERAIQDMDEFIYQMHDDQREGIAQYVKYEAYSKLGQEQEAETAKNRAEALGITKRPW